jgi:hypothetical protein
MRDEDRASLQQAARDIVVLVEKDDVEGVKAATLPKIAAQFDGIANGIQAVAPLIKDAVPTVTNLYLLDASDLKQAEDETQFFCSVGSSTLNVVFNLQQLPPGKYGFAAVHASGVAQPQQFGLIFSYDTQWKLAGFYWRPLMIAGHDGIWYWKQAREYTNQKQRWNAYFYYQATRRLLTPVDFMSSPNLEKLDKEHDSIAPSDIPSRGPTAAQPLSLTSGGANWKITGLDTDTSFGGLDLVVHFEAQDTSDPVATRAQCVNLMRALLAQHAELRGAFHGLWVFADAVNARPYAIELPMNQIE